VGSNPAGRANNQAFSQSARLAFRCCATSARLSARSYPLEALNSVMLGVAVAAEILFDATTSSPISAAE